MILTIETVKMFRTPGGRRYLTSGSAYNRAAWERIKASYPCECEPSEIDELGRETWPGALCERHDPENDERFRKLARRVARLMERSDRRARR